jgi:hypothetical protein
MGLQETVAALRRQADEARVRHARAVTGTEVAAARAEQVREELRGEFGVTTVEEARTLLAQLREEADGEAAEVTRLLGQAGGEA